MVGGAALHHRQAYPQLMCLVWLVLKTVRCLWCLFVSWLLGQVHLLEVPPALRSCPWASAWPVQRGGGAVE
jgi:hypothetical protein